MVTGKGHDGMNNVLHKENIRTILMFCKIFENPPSIVVCM